MNNNLWKFRRDRIEARRWSIEDDHMLRQLVQANMGSRTIAKELGRTLSAVRNRARLLNVALVHASRAKGC